jgi:nickel transport protein
MIKTITLLISLLLSLEAHDMWIDNEAKVHYGHEQAVGGHGKGRIIAKDEIARHSCKKGPLLDADTRSNCDALLIELKGVYYTKTPYGTKKIPKNEAQMVLKSWQSIESVKRIYNDAGIAPLGRGLELSLINLPSSLHVSDKLRLLVTQDGVPKAGVAVANGDRIIGASDVDGRINVRVREAGLQHISASYKRAGDGLLCDEIVYATTLNLEIAE